MQISQLTAHDVLSYMTAANNSDHSSWNLGATKKYNNGGSGQTYQSWLS